ncbi:MAG: arsenate reductase/protein-tyrosine-phosphatase family protein [Acidimicrobiales bacterium]
MLDILVVCTANICRSPMTEVMLAARLEALGVSARVHSAGILRSGVAPPTEAVAAMAARGFDTSAHRSRQIDTDTVSKADLIIAMAREHVRHTVVLSPAAFPRTLTLKELVRFGEQAGPRRDGQALGAWSADMARGRERDMLLGDDPEDDVDDPIGGTPQMYAATAAEIDGLVRRLVAVAWPVAHPC